MDYKKILLDKINNLINGVWTVPQFEKEYYQYFLDQVPDDAFSKIEMDFFGLVQERLDWTTEKPDEDDKKSGYFDYSSYIEWLKTNTQKFLDNKDKWHENYTKSFVK